MSLRTYRKKRDFEATPEPRGAARTRTGRSFVVQKHAASHLHFDFRLEHDGVLWSWAVPKGPSLDPDVKRLAMQVEDHPIEYGGFEGTIPAGEYGGGTVMVWDRGTWEPNGDAAAGYRKGHLAFTMHGERLRGAFHVLRTHGGDDARPRWLLMKVDDEHAERGKAEVTEREVVSVKTGRAMEAIAKGHAVWSSNRSSKKGAKVPEKSVSKPKAARVVSKAKSAAAAKAASKTGRAKKRAPSTDAGEPPPPFVEPALATLVDHAPDGDGWAHEVKFDGYRILARVDGGAVTLQTRNGNDWTRKFPTLAAELATVDGARALLDGELVALRDDGVSDFQALQSAIHDGDEGALVYFAFDLLHLDGRDLRSLPLDERRAELRDFIARAGLAHVRFSETIEGDGSAVFDAAREHHLEGIVSKRRDSTYRSGRSQSWVKVKCHGRQEFVIVGFSQPKGARGHLGALLLGERDGGVLEYAGKVGTGFSVASLASLHAALVPLRREKSALASPPRGAAVRDVTWVAPTLVAEVKFTARTRDGLIRHSTFQGLRADKGAKEVVRERAKELADALPVTAEPTATPRRSRAAIAADPATETRLTHPDRVLYPDCGVTKRDLAAYYEAVAERMMPFVAHRPLALLRCPAGEGTPGFFQKHLRRDVPEGLAEVSVTDEAGEEKSFAIVDARGLESLVQMGALEIHTWGAHDDAPMKPDTLVFDLDPDPTVAWPRVVEAAHEVRAALAELKLESFVKTTGGKGLHVYVPIARTLSWDSAKDFTHRIADALVQRAPDRFLATASKALRKGKIFIDYLRNGRGATFIAPYSSRARPGAPVAMPLAWDALTAKIDPRRFSVKTVAAIVAKQRRDPWAEMLTLRQRVPASVVRGG